MLSPITSPPLDILDTVVPGAIVSVIVTSFTTSPLSFIKVNNKSTDSPGLTTSAKASFPGSATIDLVNLSSITHSLGAVKSATSSPTAVVVPC